jgi:predicted nucleic acid-binding Zn ribbon protein
MPQYEFRCKVCGETKLILCKQNKCPRWKKCACGGRMVFVYSPPGLVFRGKGWPSKTFRRGEKL